LKAKTTSSASPATRAKAPSKRKISQANRTQKIRQRLHDALRDKFKGAEYIRQLEDCAKDLSSLQSAMALARKKRLRLQDKEKIQLLSRMLDFHNAELAVIKTRIDLNIKRLKFVLPELRSIAITDDEGNNPLALLGSALSQLTKSLSDS
jgi:cysteinyl-tRNA synthetase